MLGRQIIKHKGSTDEAHHRVICGCAQNGWVEELRLAANVLRSSVGCRIIKLIFFDCFSFVLKFIIVINVMLNLCSHKIV